MVIAELGRKPFENWVRIPIPSSPPPQPLPSVWNHLCMRLSSSATRWRSCIGKKQLNLIASTPQLFACRTYHELETYLLHSTHKKHDDDADAFISSLYWWFFPGRLDVFYLDMPGKAHLFALVFYECRAYQGIAGKLLTCRTSLDSSGSWNSHYFEVLMMFFIWGQEPKSKDWVWLRWEAVAELSGSGLVCRERLNLPFLVSSRGSSASSLLSLTRNFLGCHLYPFWLGFFSTPACYGSEYRLRWPSVLLRRG